MLGLVHATFATPYACGITNAGGTVSFYLNESADNVRVIFDNGARTNDLGALARGFYSFSLGTNSSFRVAVNKDSPPGYASGALLEISDGSTPFYFNAPRGIAVNRNPASAYFGRIYVANSAAGTVVATNGEVRVLSDGIYVLNPDYSYALGQSTNALTGGIAFDTSAPPDNPPAANSPWRIEVGQDDNIYIADFSANTATLWRTDPNVSSGVNLFVGTGAADAAVNGHGRFGGSVIALGALSTGSLTLYALEGDLSPINGLRRYDIGAGPLPVSETSAGNAPNLANPLLQIANVTVDLDRAPDGKFFLTQNRSVGTEPGLFVVSTNDTDGDGLLDVLFNSLTETRRITGVPTNVDFLRISRAVKVSPDGARVAVIRDDNNIWIIGLTNGIPDLTTRLLLTNAPNTTLGRDVSFDAAGNLYAVSSGQGRLRIFSPGGSSTAITGSDGTFTLIRPDQAAGVIVTDSLASEAGDAATFTLTRTGNTNGELSVGFTLTGTASNGTDYSSNSLSVTFPPGATNAVVTITPLADSEPEPSETVVLTLVPGTGYSLQLPLAATAFISDNNTPNVTVTATDANLYERIGSDVGQFTFVRLGRTNSTLDVNFTLGGSAFNGVDYDTVTSPLRIPAGATNVALSVSAIDDTLVEGDETITVTLAGGSGYAVGASNFASLRLQDDDLPPVAPGDTLFSDDFDSDTASLWDIMFGANNLVDGAPQDYSAQFAYDYGADGISPAPHSRNGTTLGLKVQVNKNDPTDNGSAGVNLYPRGGPVAWSFGGDFALRFDMYLSAGGIFTTEHALAGINHSGTLTNRVTQSVDSNNTTAGGDGLWAAIATDASDLRDYGIYTVTNPTSPPFLLAVRSASTLEDIFSSPPFGFAGSPSNDADSSNPPVWAEVEMKQVGSHVTLTVNNTPVLQATNTTPFTNGNIMLGMNDQFNSIGSLDNYVIFDNVRVVRLPAVLRVNGVQFTGGNVQIDFSGSTSDSASVFAVESSINAGVGYATDAGANVQQLAPGLFRAIAPVNGPVRFYRIRR